MTDLDYLRLRHANSLESARRAACDESAHAHRSLADHYARRVDLSLADEELSLD